MKVDTSHDNPQADRRRRRAVQWEIRSTAIDQIATHDPALDGSTSSYGCDGCAAPVVTQQPRPPRRSRA